MKMKVYVSGAIDETEYRIKVEQDYDGDPDFELYDPMAVNVGSMTDGEIVITDKEAILNSHVVVAYVEKYTAGTIMEIEFAHMNNVPVMLITTSQKILDDKWIKFHVTTTFGTIEQCFDYMKNQKKHLLGAKDARCKGITMHEDLIQVGSKLAESRRICLDDGRFGMDDSKVATKLLDKNFSPMIIRKYTRMGFPLYIHLICDASLSDLDDVVHDCIDMCREQGILENDIQSLRNFTGILSDSINAHYDQKKRGCVESLAVIYYVDKMIISSLQGDCMNHESCRQELYDSLNLMTKI